jgi:hypothetical protein
VVLFGTGCLLDILALTLKADDPGWRLLFACTFGAGAVGGTLRLRATNRVLAWEQREF